MTEDRQEQDQPELDTGRALEALRYCWSEVYDIWIDRHIGTWCARRLDSAGGTIEGDTPDKLRIEILEDWALRPVVLRQ